MRISELRPPGDRPRIALHPRVTVIRGLDDDTVAGLKAALRELAAGAVPTWDGTVEVHGVMIPLEGVARLVGPSIGEPVIARIEDVLPPVPGPPECRDDDSSLVAYNDAVAAREAIEAAVEELADELSSASRVRDELQDQLAAADPLLEREAVQRLDGVDGELRRAARAADVDPFLTMADPAERTAQLREVTRECDETLQNLPAGDRATLAAAIETLRATLTSDDVLSPEAAALAEVWLTLHRRLDGIESRVETGGRSTDAVAARLESARERARAARAASTPREVEENESDELEQLHIRLVELEGRATSGVRRGTARRQLDEVHAEMESRLQELGYPTWMAYRMGNGLTNVEPEHRQQHQEAVAELEEAEAEWADLMARLEAAPELSDVLDAIERVSERAAELLDTEADDTHRDPEVLAERLRALCVPAESISVEQSDAEEHLLTTLDDCDSAGHRDIIATEAILALGESWLEVLRAADDAAVRVLGDRERAENELTAITELSPSEEADPLADVRRDVSEAEAEVAELRRGLTTVATARTELHRLAAREVTAAEAHDAKLELLETAKLLEALAASRLPANSQIDTARHGITALVPRGLGGPVPMLVDLGDADGRSLDPLAEVPDDLQVIALDGGDGVLEWVEGLGAGHAALLELGAHSRT